MYCNDSKFSDTQVWANSVDSNQSSSSLIRDYRNDSQFSDTQVSANSVDPDQSLSSLIRDYRNDLSFRTHRTGLG